METQLISVLEKTLSPVKDIRVQGENEIYTLRQHSDFPGALFSIIGSESINLAIRLAAATTLKNFIKFIWKEEGEIQISPELKALIRESSFNALNNVPPSFTKLFGESLRIICETDFPDSWPEFLLLLNGVLSTHAGDPTKLVPFLQTLDAICMRYRYESKSNLLYTEIKLVLDAVALPLTELFKVYARQMVENPANGSVMTLLIALVSIYQSLISQDLPEVIEDNLKDWMTSFNALFDLPDVEGSDILWEEMCSTITTYAQRYEEEIQQYLPTFLSQIWTVLGRFSQAQRRCQFSKSGLLFLATLAVRPQYSTYFTEADAIQTMLSSVILPNISFSNEDLEILEDDVVGFFKLDLEGFDKETVRGAAVELLRSLCVYFEEQVVTYVSPIITSQIEVYQSNPSENWRQFNAAVCIIVAICTKSVTQRFGATKVSKLVDVNQFCTNTMIPELNRSGSVYMVAADCLKYFVTFRNQLDPELLCQFLTSGILEKYIKSDEAHAILRLYAAYAIERLLITTAAKSQADALCERIYYINEALINSLTNENGINNCYIMKAVYRCLTFISPDLCRKKCVFFTGVMGNIVSAALAKEVYIDSAAMHYVFETICWFCKHCYSVSGLVEKILAIITKVFDAEITEFAPYGLQVLCVLVEQSGIERRNNQAASVDVSVYSAVYDKVCQSTLWQSAANGPAYVMLLRSFIRNFPNIALGGTYPNFLNHIASRFVASKMNHESGLSLYAQLFPYLDQFDDLSTRNMFFAIFSRLTANKTSRFVHALYAFWMRYIAVFGPERFRNVLEGLQSGLFAMAFEKIILTEAKNDYRYLTSTGEKRLIVVGILQLFQRNFINNESAGMFVKQALEILEAYRAANVVDTSDSSAEIPESSDQFNRLSNVNIRENFDYINIDERVEFVKLVLRSGGIQAFKVDKKVEEAMARVTAQLFPNGYSPSPTDSGALDQQLAALPTRLLM